MAYSPCRDHPRGRRGRHGLEHRFRNAPEGPLQCCKDEYLEHKSGGTDIEFLHVLLLSLVESDGDEDMKRDFEDMLRLIVKEMEMVMYPTMAARSSLTGEKSGLSHRCRSRSLLNVRWSPWTGSVRSSSTRAGTLE